jgi:aminopeptidase N
LLPLYDKYFGVGYPLPKLDLIAVPGLGFDAMENWGGITFDEGELLYDARSSSVATLEAARHLVGHEVAHQWFGDLVTTATWNDVWLNESFAEWMSYKATQWLNPDEEPWLNFHAAKKRAMDRDAGPAKSVVGNSFDANTSYRKGPAILRMFETYLGEDTFRRGIREYVKAHAYGNATTSDLWASLKKASGRDVGAIASTFTDQPGVPLVEVATRCEGMETVATLTQRRFTMDYPDAEKLTWQIPVTIGAVGAKDVQTVVLGGSPARLRFAGCGRAIKANLADTGYYRVKYDDADGERLAAGYAGLAAADRVNLISDQWALAQAGDASVGSYLDLTSQLGNEDELVVWTDVLEMLRQIDGLERGADGQAAFRAYARGILQPLMRRVGWDARVGEKVETAALRVKVISALGEFDDAVVIAEAMRRFILLRDKAQPLPVALRGVILETVGRHADPETYEQLHALAKAATADEEKRDFYWGMASAQDAALIDKTVGITKTDEARGQYAMMLVTAAQRSDAGRVLHDVEQGQAEVMGGGMSAGLLDAIAEHSFDAAVIGELSADAVYGGKTPGSVRSIEVQARLRPRVLAGVAEWLQRR